MRLTIIQPALPAYRLGLFQRLADHFGPRFSVYASPAEDLGVLTAYTSRPAWQRELGPMRPLLPGLEWQSGALSVPVDAGDVLVVCGAPRTLSTLAVLVKGRIRGARTLWWGHYWSSTSRPWRAALRFALMRLAHAVVFYTDQEVADYRTGSGKGVSKPVAGLNNGIETEEIVRLRRTYDPSNRPRDLLFIGRLTPKAELHLLLAALARRECAGVTLDVIGDGPARNALEKQARASDLGDRVAWHGGMVDETCIAAVANGCKAFVYSGSVGLSLIHGLAYGLPAIVHDDRWAHMPEIAALEVEKNGSTFPRGDVGALAKVIACILSDSEKLEQMSAAATETTTRTFNTEDMARRFCAAIKALRDA